MAKINKGEAIALDKANQKKFSKDTKKLKTQIKTGEVKIRKYKRKPKKNLNLERHRGLLYIAHIPHGFYEGEMKQYFKQFGRVTNLKVCRSRKTGKSKGYGYVEFYHADVAKIAAETMNNYLMFKKRIVAEYIPYEKRPMHIFHCRSSTATNYTAKSRRHKQHTAYNSPPDESTQQKRVQKRAARLSNKLNKLRSMGLESNFQPDGVNLQGVKAERDESSDGAADSIYQSDEVDSKVEDKTLARRSRKSLHTIVSPNAGVDIEESKSKTKKVAIEMNKSRDSLQSNKGSTTSFKVSKVDKATSVDSLMVDGAHRKGRKSKRRAVMKRTKKPTPLNAATVRKIARELIRKQGQSLINYVTPSTKKKSPKKKIKTEKE